MLNYELSTRRIDRIRNKNIREKVEVTSIEKKLRETLLRWYNHVLRRLINVPVRQCETMINMYIYRERETKENIVSNNKIE